MRLPNMDKSAESQDAEQQDHSSADRRRCKRLTLRYQIEVSGFDRSGQLFRDRAVTLDVSEQGCKFNLLREMECGDVVAIRLVGRDGARCDAGKPLLFEIVWIEPSECGWSIGAAKLQAENIWHIAFPSSHRRTSSQ
jgi:PilZ domain